MDEPDYLTILVVIREVGIRPPGVSVARCGQLYHVYIDDILVHTESAWTILIGRGSINWRYCMKVLANGGLDAHI